MKRALWILLLPVLASAQNVEEVVQHGENVFAQTCSAGYCHGPKGGGGGAPRLTGRSFDQAYINNVVTRGVPGTAMPSFATGLSRADLAAVVAYVATLNGIANPNVNMAGRGGAPEPAGPTLSAETTHGRELFSDALLGFNRCSTCHEVEGIGIAVTKPIEKVPADAAALKKLATPDLRVTTIDGEAVVGLLLKESASGSLIYDLTTRPPVLRSVPSLLPAVQTVNTRWEHSDAITAYSTADLNAILAYLRAVVKQ